MPKNILILIVGLAGFVACALGGLLFFAQNNKGLNKGVANLVLTKTPAKSATTPSATASTTSSASRHLNFNAKEEETLGEWSAVYTKTGKFETKFEENYYDDKTFRLEFRHIEKHPLGGGLRGEVTIVIKFLGRGKWYCKGDRIIFDIKSIPVLHVDSVKIDAPDIANTHGTGVLENARQEAMNSIQQAVNEKKAWLMAQTWYFDIVSSDGSMTVCRDRTGETLYRYKVLKPETPK